MRGRSRTSRSARLVLLAWSLVAPTGMAWGQTTPQGIDPCTLLTAAEVEKVAARRLYGDPEPVALGGGAACDYGGGTAQLLVFSGDEGAARLDALVCAFGQQDAPKHAVADLGPGAYVLYPKPENEYQDTIGLLVVPASRRLLAITLAAADGEPAESMVPGLVALARLVLARMP